MHVSNKFSFSKRLNELLDGGLYTSEVTEVAGEISSGKTQVTLGTLFFGSFKILEVNITYKCICNRP